MDLAPLLSTQAAGSTHVARQIEAACREHGFFYVTGHGVAPDLLARLANACAAFFALPQAAKMEIAMARGGPACEIARLRGLDEIQIGDEVGVPSSGVIQPHFARSTLESDLAARRPPTGPRCAPPWVARRAGPAHQRQAVAR